MERTDTFWDFSVTTYRKPGVADACLSLQDRHGLDINVLLYCCWFGWTRGALDEETFNTALSFAEPWANEVVRPLRAARTWMKVTGCNSSGVAEDDCMALRDRIKAVEFEAEHLQQATLEELTPRATEPPAAGERLTAAASNLRQYLNHCGTRLDGGPSLLELSQIVAACGAGVHKDSAFEILNTTFRET